MSKWRATMPADGMIVRWWFEGVDTPVEQYPQLHVAEGAVVIVDCGFPPCATLSLEPTPTGRRMPVPFTYEPT